jgi:hypothetical protein
VPRHLHLAGTGTVGAAVQRWQQRSPTSSGAAVRKQIWVGVVVCVSVLVYCGGQARAGRLVRTIPLSWSVAATAVLQAPYSI